MPLEEKHLARTSGVWNDCVQTSVRDAIDNEILWLRADGWTEARIMDWLKGARFVVEFFAAQKKTQKGDSDGMR